MDAGQDTNRRTDLSANCMLHTQVRCNYAPPLREHGVLKVVARINKLAEPDLYTGRKAPWTGKWRSPSGLLYLADGDAVSDRDFLSLWRGFAPEDGWPLSRRALSRTHTPGFDIVLSPDKSISALWAISPEFDRKRIERAVMDAAGIALTRTVFRHCATTRSGKAGRDRRVETGDILAAIFPFHISRELDPQLDVSCAVFNLVRTHRDLRFRTLHAYPLYSWQKAIGATFRNRLAYRLRSRLGIVMERHGEQGEYTRIRGMDPGLEEFWSKRKSKLLAGRARKTMPDPTLLHGAQSSSAPLRMKRTATDADAARFRDEAAAFVDPDALHARIVRSASNDVTERQRDSVRREIDDIPRTLAASHLVFNTADIVARVENAAGGLFDDTAMDGWLEYALAADNLLALDHDDPNPDAVAGMAHKRMFTTRDILGANPDHKRLSGLRASTPQPEAPTEPSRW